jgi:hypothetical protein
MSSSILQAVCVYSTHETCRFQKVLGYSALPFAGPISRAVQSAVPRAFRTILRKSVGPSAPRENVRAAEDLVAAGKNSLASFSGLTESAPELAQAQ